MRKQVCVVLAALVFVFAPAMALAGGLEASGEAATSVMIKGNDPLWDDVFAPMQLQTVLAESSPEGMAPRAASLSIVEPKADERIMKGSSRKVSVRYAGINPSQTRFSVCLSKLVDSPDDLSTASNIVYDFSSSGAIFYAGANQGEVMLDTNRVAEGTYYLWVIFRDQSTNTTGYARILVNILKTSVFGWHKEGGKWYYIGNDGVTRVRSSFRQIVYQNKVESFYFGADSYMVTGWQTIGGKIYLFNGSGVMQRNVLANYNGTETYLGADGAAATNGWLAYGGQKYYLQNGTPVVGLATIEGRQYVFDDKGRLAQGGIVKGGGQTYLTNADGTPQTGWIDGKYYLPAMAVGFHTIGGKAYAFSNDGIVCQTGEYTIFSDVYRFQNGTMLTGWHGNKYYIESGADTGKRAKGIIAVGGSLMLFRLDGTRVAGNGEVLADGAYYYLANSVPQQGMQGGKMYGSDYKRASGFYGGVFYADGVPKKNTWVQTADGTWYLLDGEGKAKTGWQKSGGKWYYLLPNGAMSTGWQKLEGKWYYLGTDGKMQTGWASPDGKWYYLNKSGVMTTGWQKVGKSWYYMKSSGVMQTGWIKLSGKWYYLKPSGAMKVGWEKVGGKWYYFYSSGVMAKNTKVGKYRLGSSGAML